jgi:hypothetical protein
MNEGKSEAPESISTSQNSVSGTDRRSYKQQNSHSMEGIPLLVSMTRMCGLGVGCISGSCTDGTGCFKKTDLTYVSQQANLLLLTI